MRRTKLAAATLVAAAAMVMVAPAAASAAPATPTAPTAPTTEAGALAGRYIGTFETLAGCRVRGAFLVYMGDIYFWDCRATRNGWALYGFG